MPKLQRLDPYGKKSVEKYLAAAEKSLFELRFGLAHYFAQKEDVRARFTALERLFKDFANDCRKEVDRRVEEERA